MGDPPTEPPQVVPDEESLGAEAAHATRLDRPVENLRAHTARGTVINSGFQIGLSGLGAIQRIVVAAFLTRAQFGLWGVLLAILVNLSWLKEFGIGDKFIQQNEPDQEAAFQKAFTLELMASSGFLVLVIVVLPLWALAYGHSSIILPGVLVALTVPLSTLEMPALIPYRRLDYKRNRLLTAIDPIVGFSVTVGLAVAGAGYWCFVAGLAAGTLAGSAVCVATCPYRLRLRFERSTLRDYASFSWPLVGAGLSRLLVVQGSLLVANRVVGLAGIGAIGLATSVAVFADRVDNIVSQTLYPAVCAVVDRLDLLAEAVVKSNRVALMWAMPFSVGIALFAGDGVTYVLGERWRPAVGLLVAIGLTCGFGQVAFNWAIFLRAMNNTRPILVSSLINVVAFLGVSIPATIAFGLPGYAAGFAAATLVQIVIRGYYMRRLFGDFSVLRQLLRAVAPTVPCAAIVLAIRAISSGHRTAGQAIVELVAYAIGTILFTYLFERPLVKELADYLLGRRRRPSLQVTGGALG